MDLAVVGGSEFTLGFMLAGIKNLYTLETERPETLNVHAEKMLDELWGSAQVGIVIIDDHLLSTLDERLREKVERSVKPVFVPLSTESSQETLRKMIIKSIGVDLMRE